MDQTTSSYHDPVLAQTCVEMLAPAATGIVVDGTFGGGGHSRALLAAYPEMRIIAIDRDPDAVANAPSSGRIRVIAANFADMERVVARDLGQPPPVSAVVDGVLLDLGVSSFQVDTAGRGFSYRRRGPVDMRMGPDAEASAGELVNTLERDELRDLIRRYGEERFAPRIADAIIAARPITDTAELAAAVAGAVPAAARRSGHPARKTFQALRIAVNTELESLASGLEAALSLLRPGGRLCVIAYHSLEDRIVKRRIARGASGCICPPGLPVCTCGHTAELVDLGRFRPSAEEVARNPRARSAVLRVAEKVAV